MRVQARVVFVLGAYDRQCEHQDQVDQHRYAAGDYGHDDENRPHPLDGNAGVGGQTLAYTEDPFAFLEPAKAARAAKRAGVRGIAVAGVDYADLFEDDLDFLAADNAIFRAQRLCELLADRLLEIAKHLFVIRIALQARSGALEIRLQRLVGIFLQLKRLRVPAQADLNHCFHDGLPNSSMRLVRDSQYSRNSASCLRPVAVSL